MNRYKQNITITHPELIKEWNYELNGELIPEHMTAGSNKKVWWVCSSAVKREIFDHIWEATICSRTSFDKNGCPCCDGKKVVKSNCLLTTHPELCEEWNYELNGNLKPENFVYGSAQKVWWKCKTGIKDHIWKAKIGERAGKNKTGCIICLNRISVYSNCLLTTHPELCEEWNYELNGNLKPEDFTAGSNKKVWWKCKTGIKDHIWKAKICKRAGSKKDNVKNRHGCPCCSGNKVVKSNCLATTHRKLLEEWNYELNGELKPEDFTAGSNKRVWWVCKKFINEGVFDHIWETKINNRTGFNKRKCPCCEYKKVVNSNCLLTTHPELCKEWHYELNGNLKPEDFTAGSNKKVWWVCNVDTNHRTWYTMICKRTKNNKTNCPSCNQSKGEKLINEKLITHKFNFVRQNRFKDCKNIHTLPFDFYLSDFNICIEYHGEQHYEAKDYFGGKKGFKKRIKNDLIKEKYCKDNNIKLLVIKYDQFDNIPQILTEFLNLSSFK